MNTLGSKHSSLLVFDRGPNYFEVDIDVGSSRSAASVVGLVQGALKGLVIDMAITMEGHTRVRNFVFTTPCHCQQVTIQGQEIQVD